MFNSALENHPNEAAIIGLLVVGYPDLDLALCSICGLALGNRQAVLEALHKVTSEQARIEMANSLAKHVLKELELSAKFGECIGAITHCRKIRNQYAHAQWMSYNGFLHFLRAENVNFNRPFEEIKWKSTSIGVLKDQLSYFEYARECLVWIEHKLAVPGKALQWPQHMRQPPLQDRDDLNIPHSHVVEQYEQRQKPVQ